MSIEKMPVPGDFYKHFKGRLYQIRCMAKHSESGELLVIYQAMYGDFGIYARPLEMFTSEVDRDKYPDAAQKYRFERVEPEQDEKDVQEESKPDSADKTPIAGEHLLKFLEAESYADKKAVLLHNKTKFTQEDLDSIYATLEVSGFGGNERQQVAGLVRYLDMQEQYEGSRLRN